jgi:hypothetical protein
MRLVLLSLVALFLLSLSRTAHADPRLDPSWATPALREALLDGWHARASPVQRPVSRSSEPADARKAQKDPEPGVALTQAVERMWSQVRAYRRPGGAEVIVLGKF